MLPCPEIDRLVQDGDLSIDGKPDDIRGSPEFRAQDMLRVEADQPRDKEMVHFASQRGGMRNEKFHGETTVLKIDDLPLFPYVS